jgi:hypothetical protein
MRSQLPLGPRRRHLFSRLAVAAALAICCQSPVRTILIADVTPTHELLRGADIGSLYTNALDAIIHLRPEYLTTNATAAGPSGPHEPVVYLDGNRLVGLEALRGVPVSWVLEIRYIRGSVAGVRYGEGHAAGALLVTTVGRR